MAQAFYPTNDGHIGNLKKLPTPQILEMIRRQENLIKKRAILQNLPDKGKKFGQLLETLKQELLIRKNSETGNDNTDPKPDGNHDSQSQDKVIGKPGVPVQRLKQEENSGKENGLLLTEGKTEKVVKVENDSMDTDQKDLVILAADRVLERHFESLHIQGDTDDTVDKVRVQEEAVKHYYEIAEERAKKNALQQQKKPIKLNSTLKVTHVKELPEYFINSRTELSHSHKQVTSRTSTVDESSAVPPCYKYDGVKMVSLTDSLQLQQTQKQKQEELQAILAAEKLTQRLDIRQEPYNPEGTDMSYRDKMGGYQEEMDSDDDQADDEADKFKIVPSDTED